MDATSFLFYDDEPAAPTDARAAERALESEVACLKEQLATLRKELAAKVCA